ncbi:MAG TPA: invasion associated locus B family protein [Rhizomicrobium sp.]|nr:invasion associated locus B family protein [Rhizomicrobium sp.]
MNDQMKALLPRIAMGLGVFIVGALVGWFVRGPGSDGAASIRVYDDWRVICPGDKDTKASCQLTSELIDPKTGTQLSQFAIGSEDGKPTLVVRVPLTVLIPAGVGLQFGSDTQTFQYATCAANGCIAFVPFDDKIRSSFASATSIAVVVTASQNGKSVNLPMSIKGYAEATKALNNSEARRHSWWRRL